MATLVSILEFQQSPTGLVVDRDAGVIRRVKICGHQSTNTHGVRTAAGHLVEGTDYTPEALAEQATRYEGKQVNVNHPPRERPNMERSSYDRFGQLRNVTTEADGNYGDLHYLKAHPLADVICEAAERMPDAFALSHNAMGGGEVRGKRWVVTHVPEVKSVDIVADGGSCRSLIESKEAKKPMKTKWIDTVGKQFKLARLFESLTKSPKLRKCLALSYKRLLEDGEYGTMEVDAAAPAAPTDIGHADDAAEDEGWEHHLGMMLMSIVKDEAMSPEDKVKKITGAVKELIRSQKGEEEEGDGEEEGPTMEADDECDEDEMDKKEMKKMKESLQRVEKTNKALVILMESGVRIASPMQVKALAAMDTEDEMKALAATFGVRAGATVPTQPKSAAQGAGAKVILEGKDTTANGQTPNKLLPNADKLAAGLRSWN